MNKDIVRLADSGIYLGCNVKCVANDPADERYGIPIDKRWYIGDEFVVADIMIRSYGIFICDSAGHNIKLKRVQLIN